MNFKMNLLVEQTREYLIMLIKVNTLNTRCRSEIRCIFQGSTRLLRSFSDLGVRGTK